MPSYRLVAAAVLAALVAALFGAHTAHAQDSSQPIYRSHAITLYGDPLYGPDTPLPYANTAAPKGGEIRSGTLGSFDHFNPFISEGQPASASFESLLFHGENEPFTMYGWLAEEIEWPEDRSWIIFHLNPKARWHDGKPVRPEDVVFSFNKLIAEGAPLYRFYYSTVEAVEKVGERSVRFSFAQANNRELPLIVGQLPIFAEHDWKDLDFSAPRKDPPLASGPYRIADFTFGRKIVRTRVADWWAADLPQNRGRHNFDSRSTEYFRDYSLIREVVKGGRLDFITEIQAKAWASDYDIDAVRDGHLNKHTFSDKRTRGMQAFVFNLRRPLFEDIRVREAINLVFDFEWTNKTLLFDQYRRATSYFNNSELGARNLPEGEELEILERYRDSLPPKLFTEPFTLPQNDGSGKIRGRIREALVLLGEAGWEVREDGGDLRLINRETGEPFGFTILIVQSDFERLTLPFVENLKRLGITAKVRLVDTSQYVARFNTFDFDMVIGSFGQSDSPGNEQKDFWGSVAADTPGSRNLIGLQDPIIDELIALIIAAESRESLVQRTRALDRVLSWGWYVVPQWYAPDSRLLWWDRFSMPETIPYNGPSTSLWWYDQKKAERLEAAGFGDATP